MSYWADILDTLVQTDGVAVLVTVGTVKGSTPRETGATMLVTKDKLTGTIGGGRLEYIAIQKSQDILAGKSAETDLVLQLPLGPELAQCCGGYVDILISKLSDSDKTLFNQLKNDDKDSVLISRWSNGGCHRQVAFENEAPTYLDTPMQDAVTRRLEEAGAEIVTGATKADFSLVQSLRDVEFRVCVFGAGHVGRAVVQALASLPCAITWIDKREGEFPDQIPSNATKIVTDSPVSKVSSVRPDSFYLVMTHSHQLDLEICEAILRRGDETYLGLIGSNTKKAKFEKRLAVRGLTGVEIARMTCPIGLNSLGGKRPAEIAISVAADLLMRHQHRKQKTAPVKSVGAYGP